MSNEVAAAPRNGLSINVHGNYSPKLTGGQTILMDLIRKCYAEGTPITLQVIYPAYFQATPQGRGMIYKKYMCKTNPADPTGYRICWYEDRRYDDASLWDDPWHPARTGAEAWFRQNLGSCIVKGRLVAIPVIEI